MSNKESTMTSINIEKFKSLSIGKNDDEASMIFPSILATIILTKELYKNNVDIHQFTLDVLGLEYKDYLFSSRTLLYSRVVKDTYLNKNSALFIQKTQDFLKKNKNEQKKKGKIKSQNDIINEWRKVIKSHE